MLCYEHTIRHHIEYIMNIIDGADAAVQMRVLHSRAMRRNMFYARHSHARFMRGDARHARYVVMRRVYARMPLPRFCHAQSACVSYLSMFVITKRLHDTRHAMFTRALLRQHAAFMSFYAATPCDAPLFSLIADALPMLIFFAAIFRLLIIALRYAMLRCC